MKIAIVCDRVYPYFKGGVEKRYWDLSQQLIKNGHEVHYYTGQWPEMEKEMVIEGIYVHGVYEVKSFYVDGKKSIKESIKFSLAIFPALMKAEFDVIDCDQFPLLHIFSVKLVSLLRNKRMILTWSEAWGTYWIQYLGFKGIFGLVTEFLVTKLPHKIISISEHTTEGLAKKTRTSKTHIITIPIGIDSKTVELTQSSRNYSDIIFVGRLLDHKHVDLLVDAIGELAHAHNKDIRCIVVGNGPEKTKLIEKTIKLKLNNNIQFLGNVTSSEEIFALMKSSKVFVLPSTREGFGITVLEANACGLPVITIEHEGNASKKHIKTAINGFLVKLDPIELAETINCALTLNGNMKNKCKEYALKYSWEFIMEDILSTYGQKHN